MAKVDKIKLNNAAMRQLLRSQEVQDDLGDRADNIAMAAGPGMEVEVTPGRTRARAMVWTGDFDAIMAEAKDRDLSRAIDAGRHR